MATRPIRTFIVYARSDRPHIDQMRGHLMPLVNNHSIEVWYDGELVAGDHWEPKIKTELYNTDLVLLMVSPDYLKSQYIQEKELKIVQERFDKQHCLVLPIIIEPCLWEEDDFIRALQVLPEEGHPVNSKHWYNSNEAWVDVGRGIRKKLPSVEVMREAREKALEEEQAAAEAARQKKAQEDALAAQQAEAKRLKREQEAQKIAEAARQKKAQEDALAAQQAEFERLKREQEAQKIAEVARQKKAQEDALAAQKAEFERLKKEQKAQKLAEDARQKKAQEDALALQQAVAETDRSRKQSVSFEVKPKAEEKADPQKIAPEAQYALDQKERESTWRRLMRNWYLLAAVALGALLVVTFVFWLRGEKDSDGDGVPDRVDACASVFGDKNNGGCLTDTDGDGTPDEYDKCPGQTGEKAYGGCPIPTPSGQGGGKAPTTDTLKPAKPTGTYTETVNGVSFTMVAIPGGTFTMGDLFGEGGDDEKQHPVTLSGYHLGATEVTQALWRAVMGSNPSHFSGCAQCPVEQVIWKDAVKFIGKLNKLATSGYTYRLPTEAEWEYAAREGGKKVRFGNGSNEANPAQMNFDCRADYKKPYSVVGVNRTKTTPVKTFAPNALGLYDMAGNVEEWCADWYGEYGGKATNPKGPNTADLRVFRGGSWGNYPLDCRVACRGNFWPDFRDDGIGFRLASQ